MGWSLSRRRLLWLAGSAGAAAALGVEPQAAAGPARTLICREAWGARPPLGSGKPHTPTRMTLHHTEVYLADNADAPARLRQHQRYHQDSQGWNDIAYHISVDSDGNLYELRDPMVAGDTATGYDPTNHFLVVCEGDFDEQDVTEAQLDGAAFAFAWAHYRFGIASDTLFGHRDYSSSTTCPGANLYAHLASGDLKRRVDELIAAGPVELVKGCAA